MSLKMSLADALRANHLKCRLSRCVLQIRYACATIATDIRHTPLIRACTKPDKVAGTLQTFRFSLLISNETCAVTLGAHSYRTSKCVKDKGYHTQRQQESKVIPTSTASRVPVLCPERQGTSRYFSSRYMLGSCE